MMAQPNRLIIPDMRRIFPLAALMIAAIWPIFTSNGLPAGADVSIHFWRTFDLGHSWGAGDWLARWSELFYTGYGAPSFAYTGAAFYALATVVGNVLGLGDVGRVKAAWALSVILLTWGTYRFAEQRWGWASGLVAAAVLVFSPALYHTEALGRGSFGVILGFGAAMAGLALLHDVGRGKTRRMGWAAACLGVMMHAHNLTALQGVAVVGGWLVWASLFERGHLPAWRQCWLAFGLGIGLGASLWLPVLAESSLTRLSGMTGDENLDFRNHFISLPVLLEAGQLFDARLINNPPHHRLGIAEIFLSLPLLFLFHRYRPRWRTVAPWAILTALSVFLVMPESRAVWERVPPLQQFLFPQRFLNTAAIGLAMIAGFVISGLPQGRLKPIVTLLALVYLIGYGYLIGQTRWRVDFPEQATVQAYFEYEQATGIYGGTSADEFLPPTVLIKPGATGFLMESLAEGRVAQRINPYTLPEGTAVDIDESGPTRFAFSITTQTAYTLEILQTYSPLWTATINQQPVSTRPSEPYGFTLIDIPVGGGVVLLDYPLSPAQAMGLAVTWLCIFTIIAVSWGKWRQAQTEPQSQAVPSWGMSIAFGVVVIVVAMLHVRGDFQVRSDIGQARTARVETEFTFSGGQQVLGYSLTQLQPDALWELIIYWESPPTDSVVNSFVHVLNTEGVIIAQQDKLDIRLPAAASGLYLGDRYLLRFNAPPPEDFQVRLGLWACDSDVNAYDCSQRRDLGIVLLNADK